MSSDLIRTIDSLDSRQLRETLGKLEQQRSVLIVLLRAAVARDRKKHREKKSPAKRGAAT